jgi:hypothetical protein
MQRTRRANLVLVGAVVGLLSYAVLAMLLTRGLGPVPVPGITWAAIGALAVVVLLLGRSVRRFTEGRPTRMDALAAARVAVLAKAGSHSGAALAGYFAAQGLSALANLGAPMLADHAWSAGAAALACLVLVAVSLVVESWCELPPDDDGEPA